MTKFSSTLICEGCLQEILRTSHNQRFCPSCATKRKKEKRSKSIPDTVIPRGDVSMWYLYVDTNTRSWKVSVCMGYTPALFSKNRAFGLASSGQRFFKSHSRKAGHKKILGAIGPAINKLRGMGGLLSPRKTWVVITVLRPNDGRDCDPINFVDSVCDAIKEVLGVDDRWFAVVVDWKDSSSYPDVQLEIYQGSYVEVDIGHRPMVCLQPAGDGIVLS